MNPTPPCALPPEIISLIIDEFHGNKADLLRCSQVCRTWLPFTRNKLYICLRKSNIPSFIQLTASPQTTLIATIGHLELWSFSDIFSKILPMLSKFTSLRTLVLSCRIYSELPLLPFLHELNLNYTDFPSYANFTASMLNFAALRSLKLSNLTWRMGPEDGKFRFPSLDLQSLHLDWNWHETAAIAGVVRSVRTRKLIFDPPIDSEALPDFLSTISQYLRILGAHLHRLELDISHISRDDIGSFNFSHCPNLTHLQLNGTCWLSIHDNPDECVVGLHSSLIDLLMATKHHASLRTLVLPIINCSFNVYVPFADLADLLETSPFIGLQTVEFTVHDAPVNGSSRLARLKTLVLSAIPSRDGRQVQRLVAVAGSRRVTVEVSQNMFFEKQQIF
ncbi:hypothetical protein C8F04DRAFT_1358060 [Mycena alexandri]|uniref:F-box domain-containing protein n=1 Tax=Mycena alexandri TaxID=1745969 RepID=A0AAD6WYT3_9AGAR|nr:hypothetical protein C8F04DRAFT_1358060 [Mycena alexandri]